MGLKFVDNLKRAFAVLKDGRFKNALVNALLIVDKLRQILTLLQAQAGDPTIERATAGVDGGLFRVADILLSMLKFFGAASPVPVQQASTQTLDEALDDLKNLLDKTKKVNLPENVVPSE